MNDRNLDQALAREQIGRIVFIGTVESVSGNKAVVKFKGSKTAQVPMVMHRAGLVNFFIPVSVGEQVIVYAPGGDFRNALIAGSLSCTTFPAPNIVPGTALITAGQVSFQISTSGVDIVGAVNIQGNVTVSNGDVVADGISLKNHKHPGDSGGTTGKPI